MIFGDLIEIFNEFNFILFISYKTNYPYIKVL